METKYTIEEIKKYVSDILKDYNIERAILVGDYINNDKASIDIALVSLVETDAADYYNILESLKEKINHNLNLYYDSNYAKCNISKDEISKGTILYQK